MTANLKALVQRMRAVRAAAIAKGDLDFPMDSKCAEHWADELSREIERMESERQDGARTAETPETGAKWAARCGMVMSERDIAMHALRKIAKRIPREPSHSREAMTIIAATALDKIGNVFAYCQNCGGAHPRDPVIPGCNAETNDDADDWMVTRSDIDKACKAYNDQSMQLADAQYVCMGKAFEAIGFVVDWSPSTPEPPQ